MTAYWNYSAQKSIIHLLDPWTKLIILAAFAWFIFAFSSPAIITSLSIPLLVSVKMAHISLRYTLSRLKFLLWFFIMGNLFYLFFTPGSVILFINRLGLAITWEGVTKGIVLIFQLSLIATASFLVLTTTPLVQLIKSIQSPFYPFFRLGLSVPDMSLMMIIAFQFVPILMAEGKRIAQIQRLRGGWEIEKGLAGYIGYVQNIASLIAPVFFASIRKTHTMALAIELRGYTGEVSRQQFYFPHFKARDIIAFLVVLSYMGGLMIGARYF